MNRQMYFLLALLAGSAARAQGPGCDLREYKPVEGLKAESTAEGLAVTWEGAHNQALRAIFAIRGDQPEVRELAIRKGGGWAVLARDLSPEFDVVSGRRRISEQQLDPLRKLNLLSPEFLDKEKWKAFWDAPLEIPGAANAGPDMPRRPEEIRRATATYHATGCAVKTDGARLEVTFPGLSMGIFSGDLRFTVYKGTNLLRQEAIARTEEPSVAYKYNAGLKGFRIDQSKVVMWRDVARAWQKYEFGGAVNRDPVGLRARNRLAIVETAQGSVAVFPPPHKFFWAREIELNLGYVFYRKDSDTSFTAGVRQPEHEEEYRAGGISDDVWKRRSSQARHNLGNFALYNAPPGTWQHMAVYYYLSADNAAATDDAVLAFTHGDTYKAMPGYKVAVSHFHTHFNEQLSDQGTLDYQPTWLPTFRALGINIAMMSDFHGDGHANDPGPLRFHDEKVYFDGCRRFSDRDFLIMPGEEPDATLGGHYTTVFPRPVFWSKVKQPGQQFIAQDPQYGQVYHVGSQAEELEMLRREQGLMWQAHPRTKGSSGYPDAVRESAHFRSDRFLGGSYQSLPVDLSEKRICEGRCLELLDDMNNWAGPKYMIAEGDTYQKFPDDETYPHLFVNYVKLDRVPGFGEDWGPILRSMRAGNFFVTSGEVLFRNWGIEGSGAERTFAADVEWTFPLEFVELVWGDGDRTDRKIISATGLAPFGHKQFRIPFQTSGKKWVRFAAWDSAGDGAILQPVHLR
ncbi:MAG TPA: hypothetical protein VFA33_06905 [Bryobacteraceae bacterium]|nr:hypothetical protein [Bryobacteraceae bacterium]